MRLDTVHNDAHRRLAIAVSAVICAIPTVGALLLVGMLLVMIFCGGCMSARDGRTHTLFTGLQYERALQAAEDRGAVRVASQAGGVRWIDGEAAEVYRARRARAYKDGSALPVVEPLAGRNADEIRDETYPAWLRAVAWLGDGLTWAGIGAGATYGGARLLEEADRDSAPQASMNVAGSGNTIYVQTGHDNQLTANRDTITEAAE